MKSYAWNEEKDHQLQAEWGISFGEVLAHIAAGDLLDVVEHPNPERYSGQQIFVVQMREYVWLVPFVESENEIFLKTIIPSGKATKKYLGRTE